ncbi:pseudouridine synthase [Nocardia sp. NPDC056100]|uniref:pseudouridine synthase n=1 Tax=Nocardia sp. NPDC056100 TaxID=3345712 RepID=UPI0035D790AB
MNTPARRDGTPDRSKRNFESPRGGSQAARGRTDRSASSRDGDSYGNSRGGSPRGGSRGDSQSYGGSSRGSYEGSRGDSRGGSGYGGSRGDSRGGSGSYGGGSRGDSRGGSGSYGGGARGDSRGGSGYAGSRGDSRGGSRGGSGSYGDSRGSGSYGSRGDSRGGSGSYDSRGGSRSGGGSFGDSRGAAPSARGGSAPRGGAPRTGDSRGAQGRTGFGADRTGFGQDRNASRGRIGGGRPLAPSTSPTPKKKVHRPSPALPVMLSNAKPARHQHVEDENRETRKKLPWGEGERLQKVLAKAGVASRRVAEDMIEAGRIEVDGRIVTEQGLRIDPENAVVRVDGVRVVVRDEQVYLALNKPKGWQSTMSDEMGRPCVGDIVAERIAAGQRLFHVGRLDADTEGLLLLTNDGDLAHRLMHPSYEVSKTYLATVNGEVNQRNVAKLLRDGVELEDGPAKADKFQVLEVGQGKSLVKIVLHEGRKHIVRRLLAEVGHPVTALVRTHVGPVALGDQRPGALRVLGRDEIGKLYEAVSL